MTIGSLHQYRADGRMRGSFVYLLICHDDGPDLYIKAGLTDQPGKRLASLRAACPVTPRYFYTAEVQSRDKAKLLEAELLFKFQPWHHSGEWFKVPVVDKTEFNQSWRIAFAAHRSPSWPLTWEKLIVQPFLAYGQKKAAFVRMKYRRRGRAFQDFQKDLRKL